jgi:osmotically-inducible protein OsmY
MGASAESDVRRRMQPEVDLELQRDVQNGLDSAPGVDSSGIGVSVERGIVHLDGSVRDAAEDSRVRAATFRVRGVVCVVDRLRAAALL